jgi:hypothetical protein
MTPRNRILVLAGLILVSGSVFWGLKHRKPLEQNPPKTVAEILSDREVQAKKSLDSPLGRTLSARDWAGFDKVFEPKRDAFLLAQVVRSLFVVGGMESFTLSDRNQVLTRLMRSAAALSPKDLGQAGLLFSQFERVPAPPQDSKEFKTLLEWISTKGVPADLKRVALLKLVLNDADPDAQAISAFEKVIAGGEAPGYSRADWILKIDDIRNAGVLERMVGFAHHHQKSLTETEREALLVLMSRHLDRHLEDAKKMLFERMTPKSQSGVEAVLNAAGHLVRENKLSRSEIAALKAFFGDIGDTYKTPFTEMKIQEIRKDLERIGTP